MQSNLLEDTTECVKIRILNKSRDKLVKFVIALQDKYINGWVL